MRGSRVGTSLSPQEHVGALEAGQSAWKTAASPAGGLAVRQGQGIHLPPGEQREGTGGDTAERLEAPAAWPHAEQPSAHSALLPLVAQLSLGGPCVGAQHWSLSWGPSLVSHPGHPCLVLQHMAESEFLPSWGNWSGRRG